MQDQTRLAVAITMAAMFTLVGLAGPALADKDDPVNPKVHKEDTKHQYVNLGVIGDIGIFCGILPTSTGDIVVPDGSRDGTDTILTDTPINIPGLRQENLCLGGAIGEYNSLDSRSSWDVWIHDYVWNGCDAYTIPAQDGLCPVQPEMGLGVEGIAETVLETASGQPWTVELKSAGLARTQTTYDRPAATKAPGADADECVPLDPSDTDPTDGPRVCLQENIGAQSALRITNTFGFCGQGSIDSASGMVDPFDTSDGPDGGSAQNVTVTKQVFTDSVLFYLLDCPLTGGVDLQDNWVVQLVKAFVNWAACPDPVFGIIVLCLFDFPVVVSCYSDKLDNNAPATNQVNLGVVALVGEIGWTHEETNTCKDTPIHGDWIASDAGTVIELKGIPAGECVSAVYVAAGTARSVVDCEPSADCVIGGPGFDASAYAFVRRVNCTNAETLSCTQTFADLLVHVAGDEAESNLDCGLASSVSLAHSSGAGAPLHSTNPVVGMVGNPYSCVMTYRAVAAQVPYLAVAGCR